MRPTLFNSGKNDVAKVIPETGLTPASHKGLVKVYHDLVDIRNILASGMKSDSEKREEQFDADLRFRQLIDALNALGHGGGLTGLPSPDDEKDKEGWLSKFAKRYLAWRAFKGFFKAFLRLLKLGRIMPFLRVAGMILGRLFWPIAVIGVAIWLVPKIIDNWPQIMATIKEATLGVWNWVKDLFGFGDDDDEEF